MFEPGGFYRGALVAGWGSTNSSTVTATDEFNLRCRDSASVGSLWLMPFRQLRHAGGSFLRPPVSFVFGPQMLIGMAAAECFA